MEKYNLLPCPFCGGRPRFSLCNITNKNIVICNCCGASVPSFSNKGKSVELWNTRAQTLDDCPAPVQKVKNERGAGRKPFIHLEAADVIDYRENEGMTYRQIADMCNISIGSVHKIINEHMKTG